MALLPLPFTGDEYTDASVDPVAVGFAADGSLLIADNGNNRIGITDMAGGAIRWVGLEDDLRPTHFATDAACDVVYVLDGDSSGVAMYE